MERGRCQLDRGLGKSGKERKERGHCRVARRRLYWSPVKCTSIEG